MIKKFLHSQLNLMRFSAQVLVMGTILSLTFFLLAVDSLKIYRSEISILVHPKSQVAQLQGEKIVNTIVELPKTLAFYDRFLVQNPDVRDVTIGLNPDKRKEKWNEMFSIVQNPQDSFVFTLSIIAQREADAQFLASKSARHLFDSVAFYYDVKNDIDLRIIDGPISKAQVPFWQGLLFLSIIGGFALATLIDFLLIISKSRIKEKSEFFKKNTFFDFKKKTEIPVEKEIESLQNLYKSQDSDLPFVFEDYKENEILQTENMEKNHESDPAFQEMKKITKQIEPDKYPNFAEMPVKETQQEIVPENLPIADDTFFAQYEIPQQDVTLKSTPEVVEEEKLPEAKKEPTPEELKKRLNQLLRGEL